MTLVNSFITITFTKKFQTLCCRTLSKGYQIIGACDVLRLLTSLWAAHLSLQLKDNSSYELILSILP